MSEVNYKKIRLPLTLLTVLIVVTIIIRQTLAGAPVITLSRAAPLSGIVAQSMARGGGKTTFPIAGTDFKLSNEHYFDNNTWLVTWIIPLKVNLNQDVVVMQKVDGIYKVVLGPGGDFNSSYLIVLPSDVGDYLNQQGLFYAPAL